MRAHVIDHLLVHTLRGPAQRKLTQGGQISGDEVVLSGALGRFAEVHLSFLQALNEVLGREIDQLDILGAVQDRVRHGLVDTYPRNASDDIVQTFQMLNVQRRINIDAGSQQLFDIHVSFGVSASFSVCVCKLIDEHKLGLALKNCIQVHLGEHASFVRDALLGDLFETLGEKIGFDTAVCLHDANDDVDAVELAPSRLGEHLISLADAGRCPEEDLEAAPAAEAPPTKVWNRGRCGRRPSSNDSCAQHSLMRTLAQWSA